MTLRNCDMRSFSDRCCNKKIACYGIGGEFERLARAYLNYEWFDSVTYLVDGNEKKQGASKIIKGEKYSVISLDEFINGQLENVILLITCTSYYEVFCFLQRFEKLKNMECYIFQFMYSLSENRALTIEQTENKLIPYKIHYCWFGKSEMPELYKKCIDSWHKYCPDYEIIRWDESNCDIDEIPFTRQAYDNNKYGFVPDYFRLKIIYEQGGIYLDTDVEIIKSIDKLCYNDAFCGLEFPGEAALGLGFGARRNHPMIKRMIQRYENMSFVNEDGSLNEIGSPIYQSEDLFCCGMNYENKLQVVNGMTIYPIEVLSPQNVYTGITDISDNCFMWHHYDGSWLSGERLKIKQRRHKESKELHLIMEMNEGKKENSGKN